MATVAPTQKILLIKKEVFFTLPKHFLFSFFYLNKHTFSIIPTIVAIGAAKPIFVKFA